jgi:hypothetical protein
MWKMPEAVLVGSSAAGVVAAVQQIPQKRLVSIGGVEYH